MATEQLHDDQGSEVGAHECQNGDGRRVAVILIDLNDGTCDRLCGICHLALVAAIMSQLPPPEVAAVGDGQPASG
jgi:hypothetical protein